MKVKNRLAFQFTLLFALLLLIAFSGIYLFIRQFRTESFFKQLDDRAETVAQFYLAQDNLSASKFKDVQHKFPQSLSQEQLRVYDEHLNPAFIAEDSVKWPRSFLTKVVKDRRVHLVQGQKQIAGIYYADNSGNFLFIVSALDKSGLKSMRELQLIMTVVFIILLVITFFLGRIFARISLSPIVKIRDNLRTINATDLHKRLDVNNERTDEIDSLSLSINQLLEHLEQSFDNQKSFVAHASHELRTPLTFILGQAETTLINERTAIEYQTALHGIIEGISQLTHIINSLMELVEINMDIKDFQSIRADELAWEIADEFKLKFGEERLRISYDLPVESAPLHIYGNRRLLFIAINNIQKNALKFSEGKTVDFVITHVSNRIVMEIGDNGIGIAEEDISKIFQPFYRSKNAMTFPGNGIGLSLSQNILRLHNATIEVTSKIKEGTVFSISFAIYAEQ